MEDSPIFNNKNHAIFKMAATCLVMANRNSASLSIGGERIDLNPGEFWTSLPKLTEKSGLTIQQARTALKNLKKLEFLTEVSTDHGRRVSIINWALYQQTEGQPNSQPNSQVTASQQPVNSQLTANKKDKNYKKDKNNTSADDDKPKPEKKKMELKPWEKDPKFMEFIEAYPMAPKTRTNKADTFKRWKELIKGGVSHENIIEGAKHYAMSDRTNLQGEDITRGAQVHLGPQNWWEHFLDPPEADEPEEMIYEYEDDVPNG